MQGITTQERCVRIKKYTPCAAIQGVPKGSPGWVLQVISNMGHSRLLLHLIGVCWTPIWSVRSVFMRIEILITPFLILSESHNVLIMTGEFKWHRKTSKKWRHIEKLVCDNLVVIFIKQYIPWIYSSPENLTGDIVAKPIIIAQYTLIWKTSWACDKYSHEHWKTAKNCVNINKIDKTNGSGQVTLRAEVWRLHCK